MPPRDDDDDGGGPDGRGGTTEELLPAGDRPAASAGASSAPAPAPAPAPAAAPATAAAEDAAHHQASIHVDRATADEVLLHLLSAGHSQAPGAASSGAAATVAHARASGGRDLAQLSTAGAHQQVVSAVVDRALQLPAQVPEGATQALRPPSSSGGGHDAAAGAGQHGVGERSTAGFGWQGQPQQHQPEQASANGGGGGGGGCGSDAAAAPSGEPGGGGGSGAASSSSAPRPSAAEAPSGSRLAVTPCAPGPWHSPVTPSPLLMPCHVPDLWAGLPGDALSLIIARLLEKKDVRYHYRAPLGLRGVCRAWREQWRVRVTFIHLPDWDPGRTLARFPQLRSLSLFTPSYGHRFSSLVRPLLGAEIDRASAPLTTAAAAVASGALRHLTSLTTICEVPPIPVPGQWLAAATHLSGLRRLEMLDVGPNLPDLPQCLSSLAGSLTSLTVEGSYSGKGLRQVPAVVATLTCLAELRLPRHKMERLSAQHSATAATAATAARPPGPAAPRPATLSGGRAQAVAAPAPAPPTLPPSLQILDLSKNHMYKARHLTALAGLTRLTDLNLHHNPLEKGLPQCMTALTALTSLDFSESGICIHAAMDCGSDPPPPLPLPTSLRRLNLNDCCWDALPPEVCGCTALEELRCFCHCFPSLPDQISQLRSLKYLNLWDWQPYASGARSRQAFELPPARVMLQLTALTRLRVDEGSVADQYVGWPEEEEDEEEESEWEEWEEEGEPGGGGARWGRQGGGSMEAAAMAAVAKAAAAGQWREGSLLACLAGRAVNPVRVEVLTNAMWEEMEQDEMRS